MTFIQASGRKYSGFMGRCYRTTDKDYPSYGARGIAVSGAWIKDINVFRTWLLGELGRCRISVEEFARKPGEYILDRINGDSHYTPSNCRIVSPQENSRNKRSSLKTFKSAEGELINL
jgi:hypothetical protein